jgi:DNA transformation protein
MSGPILDMISLGPVTASRLAEVGIVTRDDLVGLGAAGAFRKLRFHFGRHVTLNALYGLDAAIRNVHWRSLTADRKAELRKLAGVD